MIVEPQYGEIPWYIQACLAEDFQNAEGHLIGGNKSRSRDLLRNQQPRPGKGTPCDTVPIKLFKRDALGQSRRGEGLPIAREALQGRDTAEVAALVITDADERDPFVAQIQQVPHGCLPCAGVVH